MWGRRALWQKARQSKLDLPSPVGNLRVMRQVPSVRTYVRTLPGQASNQVYIVYAMFVYMNLIH